MRTKFSSLRLFLLPVSLQRKPAIDTEVIRSYILFVQSDGISTLSTENISLIRLQLSAHSKEMRYEKMAFFIIL